jgi:hypothetical protein
MNDKRFAKCAKCWCWGLLDLMVDSPRNASEPYIHRDIDFCVAALAQRMGAEEQEAAQVRLGLKENGPKEYDGPNGI